MNTRTDDAVGAAGGADDVWYNRWKAHVIIHSLRELSLVAQHGLSEAFRQGVVDQSAILRWFILPMGAIAGGFAVHFVNWTVEKLAAHPTLLGFMGLGAVVGGPDVLPPLTVANGLERIFGRLVWTALFVGIHRHRDHLPAPLQSVAATSPLNALFVASGVWHFDRGDCHYKAFQKFCRDGMRRGDADFDPRGATQAFALYLFQAAAGVGMLWAAVGVHGFGAFTTAMLLYLSIHAFAFVAGRGWRHTN